MRIDNATGIDSGLTGSFSGTFTGQLDGSFTGTALTAISGAFDSVSASLAQNIETRLLNTTDTLTGDLTVTGKITAQEFHTEFVSASIIYQSGSTQFGNSADDTHIFSGSISVSNGILGTLSTAAQTNITSVGTLSSLAVSGNLTVDTNTLYVDASNNQVGIGTSSPAAVLEVNNDTAGETVAIFEGSWSASSDVTLASFQRSGGAVAAAVKYADASTAIEFGTTTGHSLILTTGDTERLRIDSSGNVGIGTSSPSTPLTINGNDPLITLRNLDTNRWQFGLENTQSNRFVFYDNTASSYRLIIDSSGNVGIGTSSPTRQFEVSKAGTAYIRAADTTNSVNVDLLAASSGGWVGTQSSHPFMLQTANTERMRITSTGNVGIGTAPNYTLHIDSNTTTTRLQITNSTTGQGGGVGMQILQIGNDSIITNRSNGHLSFETNGTERMRILSSGGLTFNGDTAAANALDDYEEGTFTPTFTGSTTNPTITYAVQLGRYTKIGRQVTVSFELGTSANTGGVGGLRISGLPFTVGVRTYGAVATYNVNNSRSAPMAIFGELNSGVAYVAFIATGDNEEWGTVNWTDATNSFTYINGTLTYFV